MLVEAFKQEKTYASLSLSLTVIHKCCNFVLVDRWIARLDDRRKELY